MIIVINYKNPPSHHSPGFCKENRGEHTVSTSTTSLIVERLFVTFVRSFQWFLDIWQSLGGKTLSMNEIYSCSQLKEAEMYRTMGDISIVVLVDELPTSQFWSLINKHNRIDGSRNSSSSSFYPYLLYRSNSCSRSFPFQVFALLLIREIQRGSQLGLFLWQIH